MKTSTVSPAALDTDFEAVRRVREFTDQVLDGGYSTVSTMLDEALAVGRTLREMALDEECIVAVLLHPLVTGGVVDRAVIEAHFGVPVATLVDGLTRMDALRELPTVDARGPRDSAQIERLRKLLLSVVADVRVVIVQLAATLQRMRTLRTRPRRERRQLAREGLEVYAPLASRLGIWQFKWELEDLAFRELETDTYMAIARQLKERRIDRERYVATVVRRLGDELAAAGAHADVDGRPKHIHGIWRKMQGKSLDFEQVSDLCAVRVLVGDVGECYTVLGIIHGLWKHIPREFDDYITNPKPNGYQSLHTAVIGLRNKTIEIQIRTREMHEQAELGVAAHWRYKEAATGRDRVLDKRIAWLRGVLEAKEDAGDPGGFLDQLSADLVGDRVYALTPRGEIIDLPAGATPLDFAYQIHTEIGHRCRGAKVNGAIVPLTYRLVSGNQVEILTTRVPRPSRDWLNAHLGYLATPRSRAKVRHWFRQQDYERNLVDGRDIWDRELRRLGAENPPQNELPERFNCTRFEDLLAALGRGDVSTAQLAGALQPYIPKPPERAAPTRVPRARKPRAGDVRISGVGNLLTQIARCCKPLPSDSIVGYITRGRGVSIHRQDCGNILRMEEGERMRLIDVAWSAASDDVYPVDFRVAAYDRKGLLRDVTTLLANEGVNIVALDSHADEGQQTVVIRLAVEIGGVEQMSRVLDRLNQLPNVFEARRGT